MPDWLYVVLIIIFVLFSAGFTAIESALGAVNRFRVRYLIEQSTPGARPLDVIIASPSRVLTALVLIDNSANIAAVALATVLIGKYVGQADLTALVATLVMLAFILVFGEIIPRTYGTRRAESLSLRAAGFLTLVSEIVNPIARLFIFIANIFIRLFGGRPIKELPVLTEDAMMGIVSGSEEEGMIEEEEKELIHSIFVFGDTIVREVMIPRIDMVAVDVTSPIEEVLSLITREGHSRIPIYEETIDNIIGVIYAKDLLIQMSKGKIDMPLRRLIRPAYYVPESKKVDELLRELQKKRQHMAIVVDEYGGTAGLVTIEDLLEEIVGEIFDEYDLEETLIEYVDDHTIRMDARVNIDEANEILGANLSRDDIDTIGGFVYSLFGRIPTSGEQARFENLTFKVDKVIGRRVSKILITRETAGEEETREVG